MKLFDMLAQLDEPEIPEEEEAVRSLSDEALMAMPGEEAVTEEELLAQEPEAPEELSAEPEETIEEPEILPQEEEEPLAIPTLKKPISIRAEWVMGIIAAFCAVLLLVVFTLSFPYMFPEEPEETAPVIRETVQLGEEDPEALLHNANTEPPVSETEPENPTIPPDKNPYDRFDFQYNRNNYLLLQNLDSSPGVDVSAYQGNIDWEKVKQSGIEFAIIRLGYRGYGSGKLVKDDYAVQNLNGARKAGLKVGAYFFSQALTIKEADEEIAYMMDILDGFLPDMPLILDWEIPTSDARTANMDQRTLTDIQKHYCEKVSNMGYEPMVYFNWYQSEHLYILHELEDYPFWLALYQDRMTYPWKVEMWQYTDKGKVPGINGPVDLNVYMPG